MKHFKTLALAATLTAFASAPLYAQYTGPTKDPSRTVAHVLSSGKDDDLVVLTGHITGKIGDEKYTFADQTGEMTVEIDDDLFTAPISNTSMVEIRGKIDKHMIKPTEIDVDVITIK